MNLLTMTAALLTNLKYLKRITNSIKIKYRTFKNWRKTQEAFLRRPTRPEGTLLIVRTTLALFLHPNQTGSMWQKKILNSKILKKIS